MNIAIIIIAVLVVVVIAVGLVRSVRSSKCERCNSPLVNLGRGSPSAESLGIGTMFSADGVMNGTEGPGDQCERCGRIYCTHCAEFDMVCTCGSKAFRTVRLRYM